MCSTEHRVAQSNRRTPLQQKKGREGWKGWEKLDQVSWWKRDTGGKTEKGSVRVIDTHRQRDRGGKREREKEGGSLEETSNRHATGSNAWDWQQPLYCILCQNTAREAASSILQGHQLQPADGVQADPGGYAFHSCRNGGKLGKDRHMVRAGQMWVLFWNMTLHRDVDTCVS